MTKEQAKKLLPIIQKFSEDETSIEYRLYGNWITPEKGSEMSFSIDPENFRIKGEKKYMKQIYVIIYNYDDDDGLRFYNEETYNPTQAIAIFTFKHPTTNVLGCVLKRVYEQIVTR